MSRLISAFDVTVAADQNVSSLRGGNESQACVLLRAVPVPRLHTDMGRLTPALPANLRPVDAGEACDCLSGVRNNADGPFWAERNADGDCEIAFCHVDLVRIVDVRRAPSLRRDGEKSVDRKGIKRVLSAQTAWGRTSFQAEQFILHRVSSFTARFRASWMRVRASSRWCQFAFCRGSRTSSVCVGQHRGLP